MRNRFTTCLLLLVLLITGQSLCAQDAIYIRDNDPWDDPTTTQAMDSVFGVGNWTAMDYETALADVASILSGYSFIYLNGADEDTWRIEDFMDNYGSDLETWVADGGHLVFHYASQGNSYDVGFGDIQAVYETCDNGTTVLSDHPIFTEGSWQPCDATTWTGSAFSHVGFTGTGLVTIIQDDNARASVGELVYGNGIVIFFGYTAPMYTDPHPNVENLIMNIIEYVSNYSSTQWTGEVDTDWFTPLNWSDTLVPEAGKVITIPAVPSGNPLNFPVVSGNNGYCGKLKIADGASVTVNAGNSLLIDITFTNLSDSSTGEGEIVMAGDNTSRIKGVVSNLTVSSSLGVEMSGDVRITNRLTLTDVPFIIQRGTLTLENEVTGDNTMITSRRTGSLNILTDDFTMSEGIRDLNHLTLEIEGALTLHNDLYLNGDLTLTHGDLEIGANELTLNGRYYPDGGNLIGSDESDLVIGEKGYNAPSINKIDADKASRIKNKESDKIGTAPGERLNSSKTGYFVPSVSHEQNIQKNKTVSKSMMTTLPEITLNGLTIKRDEIIGLTGTLTLGNLTILRGELGTSDHDVNVNGKVVNLDTYSQDHGKLTFTGEGPSLLDCSDSVTTFAGPKDIANYDYSYEGGLYFDAFEDFTLVSVKVRSYYEGDYAAIYLLDPDAIQMYYVEIPFGGDIDTVILNFDIPAGSGYFLGLDGYANDLYYDYSDEAFFPIELEDFGMITGNDWYDDYYYLYFYDWECKLLKTGNSDFNTIVVAKPGTYLQLDNNIVINDYFGLDGQIVLTDTVTISGISYADTATLGYLGSEVQVMDTLVYPLKDGPLNLEIANTAGVHLDRDRAVKGEFILNGILVLDTNSLLLDTTSVLTGTQGATAFVAASSTGELRRMVSRDSTYLFPVGDIVDGADYSPATIILSGGSYDSAFLSVNVRNIKHPDNPSIDHYLNRYWSVNPIGITGYTADVEFTYTDNDVVGNDLYMTGGEWNGLTWDTLDLAVDNSFTGTVDYLNEFTGLAPELQSITFTAEDEDRQTIQNVGITIDEETRFTGTDGTVIFNLPLDTRYYYTAENSCFEPVYDSIDVVLELTTELVSMEHRPFPVYFTVNEGASPIEGATVTINATSVETNASGLAEFILFNGDYDYTVATEGYDEASGSVTVDCDTVSLTVTFTPLIQHENPLTAGFAVYPNPTGGVIYLSCSLEGLFQITVTDITGNRVLLSDNNYRNAIIDLSGFESGLYMIQIEMAEGVFNKIIIKQ